MLEALPIQIKYHLLASRRGWGTRRAWNTQERNLEKEGAKRTPGSGNGPIKGDNQGKTFKIECKYTVNLDYRLTYTVCAKIIDEAQAVDSLPLIQLKLRECKIAVVRRKDMDSFWGTKLPKIRAMIAPILQTSYVISNKLLYGDKNLFYCIKFNGVDKGQRPKVEEFYIIEWNRFKDTLEECGIQL